MRNGCLQAAITAVGLVVTAGAARAQAAPPVPVITVPGEASADVAPDVARLSLGVEIERATAATATNDLAAAAQAVRAQLTADAIPDADIATAALSLQPIYPDDTGRSTRAPRTFRASTSFIVTVRPAARAGEIASHLVDKGANTIEGIDYAVSDEARRLDDLRAAAMRDARHKAEVYTGALGLHLGPVLDITPQGGGMQPPSDMLRARTVMAAAKVVVPTAPGALRLTSEVMVRWTIVP